MSKRRKRAPWIKLYGDYTTTPSHADLDAHALWVGVVVMQLVRAASDALGERTTWAVQPSGGPVSIAGIARTARLTVPQTRKAVAMLVASRTFAEREDGAIGCPRFWSFQETPDAQRKRDGRTEYPPDVRSESNQEDRGQRDSLRESPPEPPSSDSPLESERRPSGGNVPNAEPTASQEPADPHRGAAKRVLARLSEHRVRLVQGARPYKHTDTNLTTILARLREGEPEADLVLVVDHEAAKVARGSDSKWLNPTTPFRPGNWPTRLADAQAAQASQPRRVVPIRREPDQFDRDLEEARAAVEAERRAKEAADASG